MAEFLNKIRSLPLPPVKNIFNVALQTARQTIPEQPNKSDYEQPRGPPPLPPRPQNVRFSDPVEGIFQIIFQKLNFEAFRSELNDV